MDIKIKKLTEKEVAAILNSNVDAGYIKITTNKQPLITNKGSGKLTEHILDLVDVVKESLGPSTLNKELLLIEVSAIIIQVFGSKESALLTLNIPDRKKIVTETVVQALTEVVKETKQPQIVTEDEFDKMTNVISMKDRKKNETLH